MFLTCRKQDICSGSQSKGAAVGVQVQGPLRHQDQHCFCKAATVVQKTGGADQLSAYRKGQRLRGFASKHSRLALCDLKHLFLHICKGFFAQVLHDAV